MAPHPPVTPSDLRDALALAPFDGRAAQRPMEPARRGGRPVFAADGPPRPAAALAYVYERAGRLVLPVTVRTPDLPEHKGQVSLPGGRPLEGESSWETALREAEEEIGLRSPRIEEIGTLTPVEIPVSHTVLTMHVALGEPPGALVRCEREVERIVVVRLDDLLDPARHRSRPLTIQGIEIDVPYFDVEGLFLWGATAMGLSELVRRLWVVRSPPSDPSAP